MFQNTSPNHTFFNPRFLVIFLHSPDLKNHVFVIRHPRIFIRFIPFFLPVGFDFVFFGTEISSLPFRGCFLLQKSCRFQRFCEPKSFQKRIRNQTCFLIDFGSTFGSISAPFWTHFGPKRGPWAFLFASLVRPSARYAPPGRSKVKFWLILGHFSSLLGLFWSIVRSFWQVLFVTARGVLDHALLLTRV